MKNKRAGKKGIMALKLYMSKAYARIEWEFVVSAMEALDFPTNFIMLIRRCISIVSYQILLNGKPRRRFLLERGLRQGDPLSPYLFIKFADILPRLIKKAAALKELHGVQATRKAPNISHLFFTDDSLILRGLTRTKLKQF